MVDFNNLHQDILSLTRQSSRFRRVVLHLHSPQSHDFGETPDSDPSINNKDQYTTEGGENLFLSYINKAVDLIAVTDHMRSEYACRLSKWAERKKLDVKVLPGIELNIRLQPPFDQLRLHILAIFPENKTLGEIERIMPTGRIPSDESRTGKEEIELTNDLEGFIKDIREKHQGICIAAHVDKNHGIRMLFRQTAYETISLFNPDGKLTEADERQISESFKNFIVKMKFDGIEVTKPKDRVHYSWKTNPQMGVTHHVPVLLTFDAHNIESLEALTNRKKDRITYVKMSEVSWQGLKDALQFPHTRIRFSDDRVPPPYLVGVQIVSGSGEGFFADLELGFVENLNCLIGPRGSGKSTIVDAIRYVFGYNRTLDELGSPDLKKAVLERQKATLKESIIKILYRVNETEVHVLEAVYGGEKADYVTQVYDLDGNRLRVDDVERSGKYPLRLFGWSEIETLGRDPERQMDLLDKLVEGISETVDKRDSFRAKLRENSQLILAQSEKLAEIYSRNDMEVRRFQEFKQDFDRYNTREVEELFKNYDNVREQREIINDFNQAVVKLQSELDKLTPVELESKLQDNFEKNPAMKIWWDSIKDTSIHLNKSQDAIRKNLTAASKTVAKLLEAVDIMLANLASQIEDMSEQIRKKVSVDPQQQVLANLRSQSKERLDTVEKLREEYNESYSELLSLVNERKSIIKDLLRTQARIRTQRERKKTDIEIKLNEFQTEGMKVEIVFKPDGNKNKFENWLRNLKPLSDVNRTFKADRWHEILGDQFTPIGFAEHIYEAKPFIAGKTIDETEYIISKEKSQLIIDKLAPYRDDSSASVKEVNIEKLSTLLEMEELEWDDEVSILRNGQPVEHASPGQRSSAMLPLIALAEKVPLVIDQPEDNLDNRLVGKVLVDILAKLKEKRQIIVCTHNPNIVVLGDAEQVIVMDAIDNNHGRAEKIQASIDHPTIIQRVIDLMEGGTDAFDTRKRRYGR